MNIWDEIIFYRIRRRINRRIWYRKLEDFYWGYHVAGLYKYFKSPSMN